ncbi:hypothetical protein [Phytoactinopolyspora halotolerans]|uniref:Uncharacterized protein n=1 Tax=Phytoactinopolyspora halotolerans TaxID=1981512 RepID=A0A6L9SEE5_9ACTN|nr:hypothetical protein [Phytoactinopolyspora halotolerans]NEE02872.1 hypothetical protein [Phytoactinopolyspora halotolerans]
MHVSDGGRDLCVEPDLYAEPLAYPGTPARADGLLVDGRFTEVEPAELEPALRRFRVAGLGERRPVIAVGSNASPGQLWRKLRGKAGGRLVLPITLVEVVGVVAGVSAHVSRPGYLPATPVVAPGRRSTFPAIWLDAQQLPVMDATEPNYDRVPLPTAACEPVAAEVGAAVTCPFEVYATRHGHLVDPSGSPLPVRPQPQLLSGLLAESPALRELAGPAPGVFVAVMRADPAARSRARQIFHDERRVRRGAVYRA